MALESVNVPEAYEPVFLRAQKYVEQYFQDKSHNPKEGSIEIFGQRYILVRGDSLSVDLFELMKERYQDAGDLEAIEASRRILYDMAHTIGKMDARNFHKKMGLSDPIEKLSAGPIHFAHTGWAYVDISSESKPSPDEDFFLLYDHPFSFESDAWIQAGKRSDFPACVMNAGYSCGWCEESFGLPLQAVEITCKARGDEACRFIMAHPSKIKQTIEAYLARHPDLENCVTEYALFDVSKRQHMEKSLQATQIENRKLAAVASHTHCAVLMMSPDGTIDWVNDAFSELTGHTLQDVRSLSLREYLKNYQVDTGFVPWMDSAIQDKRGARIETCRRTKSGRQVWLESEILPIFDQTHALANLILIETDITERKQAEQRQKELVQEMEKINGELKEFAYVVSHDLKAPLRGIKNLVTWITEDCQEKLDADDLEQMSLVHNRVDRMQGMIDGILQYSRIGRVEEDRVRIDLNELVPDVIDLIASPEHIQISVMPDLPVIYGEQTRMTQIFQNLLSNAIKYMDKPKGLVTVECVEDGHDWRFSVTDNGPGIEDEFYTQIFGLFKTLIPKDESESTGIGLTLVKKTVELYGGRIWVESEVGQGSRFVFTLPKHSLTAGAHVDLVSDSQAVASV